MKNFLKFSHILIVLFSFLLISEEMCAWNAKHEYTDKIGKTMGKNKVHREGNEVFVEDFYYSQGIAGLNSINYSLDINEFNEYLYYVCQHTDYPFIYVTIRLTSSEDKYGNKIPGEKITIGKIDTIESQKYVSQNLWVDKYGFLKLFYKDKPSFDRNLEKIRCNSHSGIIITKVYYPKSIK